MRIASQASEQYRRTSAPAEAGVEKASVRPQARTTTTSFGVRLGKFGLDYRQERTVLDPSLSRDVREREAKARAFRSEAEVGSLRARVGREGADYRDLDADAAPASPSVNLVRAALTAYARSAEETPPPAGSMLAGVV
ncbi:MAG: hypothetical protein H0S80_12575 [Desulfovibrionaceae bacterium]|nr:hypothetical protein [Desulfovibrionaceae bacterium]